MYHSTDLDFELISSAVISSAMISSAMISSNSETKEKYIEKDKVNHDSVTSRNGAVKIEGAVQAHFTYFINV